MQVRLMIHGATLVNVAVSGTGPTTDLKHPERDFSMGTCSNHAQKVAPCIISLNVLYWPHFRV